MSTTARRRASTLEVVTEPSVLETYLCGYSLRTCTLFILWINIILLIIFFVMVIFIGSLIHFYILTEHYKDTTQYTFFWNSKEVLTINLHGSISPKTSIKFSEIGKQILAIILSSACVHIFVLLSGIIAVYQNKHKLIIPYMVLLILSVLWLSCFIFLNILLISWQYIKPVWWFLISIIVFFFLKLYQLMVIYSYYFHYSGFAKDQIKTPSHLTTQSPVLLPVTAIEDATELEKSITEKKYFHVKTP